MPSLILGPLLRHVGENEAVFWVETDEPCEVEVLGTSERTFRVCGHHYALVCAERPRAVQLARVRGEARRRDGLARAGRRAPSERLQDLPEGAPAADAVRLVPGGRAPHAAATRCARMRTSAAARSTPSTRSPSGCRRGHARSGRTCCSCSATRSTPTRSRRPRCRSSRRAATWTSPRAGACSTSRSTPSSTRRAGPTPMIRWLFSTVPSSMIFDDHDVHDDWNVSEKWLEEMRKTDWWGEHCIGALMSYWVYQHLGNLTPELHPRRPGARAREGDGRRRAGAARVRPRRRPRALRQPLELLPRHRRHQADRDRRAGGARARRGRPQDGRRSRVGLDRRAHAGRLRPPAARHFAALPARPRDAVRRSLERGGGRRRLGRAHGRLRRVGCARSSTSSTGAPSRTRFTRWSSCSARSVPGSAGRRRPRSSRCPATSITPTSSRSPTRRAPASRARSGRPSARPTATRSTARSAGSSGSACPARSSGPGRSSRSAPASSDPGIRWRLSGGGPWFDNQVATLVIDGRRMDMHLDKAVPIDESEARLERVLDARLA